MTDGSLDGFMRRIPCADGPCFPVSGEDNHYVHAEFLGMSFREIEALIEEA